MESFPIKMILSTFVGVTLLAFYIFLYLLCMLSFMCESLLLMSYENVIIGFMLLRHSLH